MGFNKSFAILTFKFKLYSSTANNLKLLSDNGLFLLKNCLLLSYSSK